MNLPNLAMPNKTRKRLFCPFGHVLKHAGNHIYYCDNLICQVAMFQRERGWYKVFLSLELLPSLLEGRVTKEQLAEEQWQQRKAK